MKIIKITESQYKRLVRSKKILSEQVVYKDPKDEMDIHSQMFRILDSVGYRLKTIFKKPLYILKIEEGIVYVDKSEYQQNEIDYIKSAFEKLVRTGISLQDKMLTGSDDLGFDSGQNGDYVWPDEEDNDDVADEEDNDEVADVDDTDSEEESECDCINTETNQRYTYNCDDDPPIECFVTDTDNEDSDTINSVTDDCENCINNLTQRQKNNIDSNINDNNVNDFRWWVNQDSGRLKQVTDKFEECCETKDDPTLNIDGSNNEWVKIAFSVVGQEWINEGKPSKPKEDTLTFTPPNKDGWKERGRDGAGSGKFGAGRGSRNHNGVDILSTDGDQILSPMDGYISTVGYRIYSNKCTYLVGVDITGVGIYEGYKIRLFYVKSNLSKNTQVKRGVVIGSQQSLNNNCYPKRYNRGGEYKMKNHVHVELYYNGVLKNPSNYNWGNKQVVDSETNSVDSSSIRQKIVDKAYSRLSEPYEWGHEFEVESDDGNPDGKGGDCSGFIDWVLRNVSGINSPYRGRETSNELRKLVTNDNMGRKNGLDKGDILIFTPASGEFTDEEKVGHVGFVYDVRGGKVDMIHSSKSKGVNILKDVFTNSYYKNHYYGAIPIVNGKYESK